MILWLEWSNNQMFLGREYLIPYLTLSIISAVFRLQAILVVKLQNLIVSVCGSMSYLTKTKEVILYFIFLIMLKGSCI